MPFMTSMRRLAGNDDSGNLSRLSLCKYDLNAFGLCIYRGTFGVVKRVAHRVSAEVFAAKFIPLKSSTRTRAFQERDLLSRLAHCRVACLLDFFSTRRTLVLITEM